MTTFFLKLMQNSYVQLYNCKQAVYKLLKCVLNILIQNLTIMTEFYEFPNEKSFPLKAEHLDCMFTLMLCVLPLKLFINKN